jgi:histidinol-phosphate aminotransferase
MTTPPVFAARATYRNLPVYDPADPPVAIRLADNTSPFGMPPAALQALRDGTHDALAQYPSAYARPLAQAFASYVGVRPEEVLVTAGSDEALSCTFRGLAEPGAVVAHMDPTFVMARVFAATNSVVPVAVPVTPELDADADALLAIRPALTYLCSPNNPTGSIVSAAALGRILESSPGIVLVDEAYAEFSGTNLARQAPAHGRMLVFRTLSKAFGMAGLRVGFAVGAAGLIRELEKARGPYTVSALSEHAATCALRDDVAWVRRGAALIAQYRDGFVESLRSAGFHPLPSAANFVLIPMADTARVAQALASKGILVRSFTGLPRIGDALRISIAAPEVMEQVLVSLREAVSCA